MIRFGPSGNSRMFYDAGYKTTLDAPKFLKEVGLSCYEYSFGRGFTMGYEKAREIGAQAIKNDILISVHAPYYVNFANPDPEALLKNSNYVTNSLKFLELMGGQKCCVHPGSCGKLLRKEAILNMHKTMDYILSRIYEEGQNKFYLCPETMGKSQQLGSVDEIIELCKMDKVLIPTFDFGHINAVTNGTLKTKDDYKRILDKTINELGQFKADNLHIHFSKIEYTLKGEVKHLTFEDTTYGPNFEPLAEVLQELNLHPTIICESKDTMSEDALTMKKIYENLRRD